MKFDPILPNHAIERCGITVTFGEELPYKLFERVVGENTENIAAVGLPKLHRPSGSFKVDLATGNVGKDDGVGAPFLFATPDEATQLHLMPNALTFVTTAYSRWQPFLNRFLAVTDGVSDVYTDNLNAKTVKLEFWDRFLSDAPWGEIDFLQLLNKDSAYIVPGLFDKNKEWHSHVGWFENAEGRAKRLTNINIGAIDVVSLHGGETRPSVGVYTLMQDEFGVDDDFDIRESASNLHANLKRLFSELVTAEMNERIGLGGT